MSTLRYAPGEAWAVVASGRCVVVRADAAPGLIDALHRALTDEADLARIIDVFSAAFGPSLYALPSFAAVFPEATGVRVAVRGDVTVQADAPQGAHEFSGEGVTTWSERVIADADRVQVRVGPGAEPGYPLADGAAQVSAVVLGQDAARESRAPETAPVRRTRRAEAEEPHPDAAPTPATARTAPATAAAEPATPAPEPVNPAPVTSAPVVEVPAQSAPIVEPEPASADTLLPAATTDLPTGMITSVPTSAPSASSTPPAATVPSATSSYDDLWGATVMRSVEDAAVRPDEPDASAEPDAATSAPPAPGGGDHDGQTVTLAQLRAMRGAAATPDRAAEEPHPPLAGPRPSAPGRLSLSDGKSVLLDRTVIIGRRPRSTRVAGTDLPHLVPVDSPQQDISRSHVEFRVEGDSIIVTDLHTTNGTLLVRTGAAPTRLHPGEATVVVVGDAIDLGDGIIVTVEAMA